MCNDKFSRPYGTHVNLFIYFPAINRWAILSRP